MKTVIHRCLFIVLIGIFGLTAFPESWTDGETGCTWSYRLSNGTVEIYSGVRREAVYPKPTGQIAIPSRINGKAVTSVGPYAFYSCYNLNSITIPVGVVNIGENAFCNCYGLISAPIPNGVTNIGERAFQCSGIEELILPDSVTSLGAYAFSLCYGLTKLILPKGVENIGARAFYGSTHIAGAFTLPQNVKMVGESAFAYCHELTDVTIEHGPLHTGTNIFSHCSSLTNVTIQEGVNVIGYGAFSSCTNLTDVKIAGSVTSIEAGAFQNDDNLKRLIFMGNAPLVAEDPFSFNSLCIAYCLRTSSGWGVSIPGVWHGIPLKYSDDDTFSVISTQDGVLLVPYDWCKQYPAFENKFGTSLDSALLAPSGKIDSYGNTMFVWQDFVAGIDPTDMSSRFLAEITFSNGISLVSWSPNLNTNGIVRKYTVLGKTNLTDAVDWAPTNSAHRFFRVKVEMP